MRASISLVASSCATSDECISHTVQFDNDLLSKVLLIVPDDKYINDSTFEEIIQNDTDFNNNALPQISILEWKEQAIKSGSFEIKDYIEIAKQISLKYLDYDGFVILDSISTIPYTASFFSFMFENLAKPVVLTGSHSNKITQIFSDAKSNLLHSLIVAGYTKINEVIVCFNKKLFRGNRIQTIHKLSHNPFISYNYPQLGEFAAINLSILLTNHCMIHTVKKRFKTFTHLFPNIIVIHLIPLLTDNTLKTLLFSQLTKKKKSKNKQLSNGKISFFSLPTKPKNSTTKIKTKVNGIKLRKASKSSPAYPTLNFQQSKTTNVTFHTDNAHFSDNEYGYDIKQNQNKNENKNDNDLPFIKSKSTSNLTRVKSIRIKRETINLNNSSLKGVIISFFGVGNAPSRESFKNVLKKAVNEYNCEIVITCQTQVGGVDSSVYASGNFLSDLNLISAVDMTVSCCVAKLSYLMGKGYRHKQLKEQFETNLRGEMTEMDEHKRRVVQHIPMNGNYIHADNDDDIIEQEIFNQKNENQSVVDSSLL